MYDPPHLDEFILATYMGPYGLSCRYLATQLDVSPSTGAATHTDAYHVKWELVRMTNTDRVRYWEEQVVAWQASGVSGQAYYKVHGLIYHQFIYWRKKLLVMEGQPTVATGAGFTRAVPAQGLQASDYAYKAA